MGKSMKKKILVIAPVFSCSGYSQHARIVLNALKEIEDKVDLYLLPTGWAQTHFDTNDFENKDWMNYLTYKHQQNVQVTKFKYDVSIQLMVPHEWNTEAAEYNIGITALVETDKISPLWIECINRMDKVLTISNFNKDTILSSVYSTEQGVLKVTEPSRIGLATFPVKDYDSITKEESLEAFDFETDFNYLCCAQLGPRKNVEDTVKWFVETFHNREDVGLVLKLHIMNNSTIDKDESKKTIRAILNQFPDKKCKVYMIHGNLSEKQLHSLYVHPKIKAIISTSHGESWGLPLFEAAYMGLPVIAPKFSGYLDFLMQDKLVEGKKKKKPFFADVDFVLKPVSDQHLWDNVIIKGSLWAFTTEASFKNRLQEVNKDYSRFKSQALKLKEILKEKYSKENVYTQYTKHLEEFFEEEEYNFEDVTVK